MTEDELPVACPRVPARAVWHLIPPRYYESLEQDQRLSSCCRHPETHEIEARYSSTANGLPDIYWFWCTCGRRHRKFVVGGSQGFERDGIDFKRDREGKPIPKYYPRPVWEAR